MASRYATWLRAIRPSKCGFNAISAVDATLGNEVLRRFTVIFDDRNAVMYLRPNCGFAAPTRFTPVPHLDRVMAP